MKIIKIVATRCQILRLKYTKDNFGWGSTADLAGEAYSSPSDLLAGFKGPTSKGRGNEEVEGSPVLLLRIYAHEDRQTDASERITTPYSRRKLVV